MVVGRAKNRSFSGAASYGLGLGIIVFLVRRPQSEYFWVGNVDGRDWHRVARRCAGTSGRSSLTEQTLVHPKASASRSVRYPSGDQTRPLRLSFALAMILTMNARRFQRTHLLSAMGASLNASNDIGMGVTDLAPIVNQSQ